MSDIVQFVPEPLPTDGQDKKVGLYNQLLNQMMDAHGRQKTMDTLARISGYESTPPTIKEFVEGDQYLGGIFDLYPIWQQALNTIYPSQFYSPYSEVVLTGSIGGGKSTVSLTGVSYDMCKLSHLKEPTDYCGLAKSTKIAFALINATLDLSKGVLMDQLDEWMQLSPYFKALRAKAGKKSYLPKNIHVVQGSRFSHVLGQAVVGAILSELNFQDRVKGQAYENYSNAKRRLQSRFMRTYAERGSYPGRIWLDSSKNDAESFLEKHAEDSKDDPMVVVYDHPIWVIQNHFGIYCGKTFKVFVGDQSRDPFILTAPEQIIGLDDALVLDVPVEYEKDFRMDIYRALKDLAGCGTWSSHTFITSTEKILEALVEQNPVSKEVIIADFFDKDQRLSDYIDWSKISKDGKPRFIHADLSTKNDNTGVACTRLEGFLEIRRMNYITGDIDTSREPVFRTEWVMAVAPKPGLPIPLYKIKELIMDVRAHKIPVASVSTDGYQSENLRQDLHLAGFDCQLISCDRTKAPYDNLKNAILEGRYIGPNHPLLVRELKGLQDDGKKIDHTSNNSKDLADAVCGSTWAAYQSIESHGGHQALTDFLEHVDRQAVNGQNAYDSVAGNVAAHDALVEEFWGSR